MSRRKQSKPRAFLKCKLFFCYLFYFITWVYFLLYLHFCKCVQVCVGMIDAFYAHKTHTQTCGKLTYSYTRAQLYTNCNANHVLWQVSRVYTLETHQWIFVGCNQTLSLSFSTLAHSCIRQICISFFFFAILWLHTTC